MKLNVFVSSTKDGIMSADKKFFPTLTKEERNLLYKNTLMRFFDKRNIQYENIVILSEKNKIIKPRVVTENNKNRKEAILILKDNTKDLCVAVETSDYPVIIASTTNEKGNRVSAIALGTIKNLNEGILHEMIESLIKETNAAPFEMTFYICACPSKEKFLIKDLNEFTNNLIWQNALTKEKKKTYLDIRYAIFNTLIKEIVDPNFIYFDSTDTIEDANYFSDIGEKSGKNLICVVYSDEEV